ncbi:MAG: hypothetical protein JSV82_06485 [Planctomycetota bacterium]|nr:MAG: hypothetical protein JSV82_06485 [Planctomycetota bacterium]
MKPLPAVPAAVFMVLSGFVCISLVKDRRAWLAALAGLLWAGQLGIEAVPQLALRIGCRIHRKQQLKTEFTHRYYLDNSSRLRSDIEGTEYIGLLHHLAGIPDFGSVFVNTQPAGIITFSRHLSRVLVKAHSYFNKNTFPSSFANISEQYSSGLLFACLASKVEQFISFSPAFIFERMPRGPPLSA